MNIWKPLSTFLFRRKPDEREEKLSTVQISPLLTVANPANKELEQTRPLVIVDVGCRWGFAEKFTKKAGRFRIFGFDPDQEECIRLSRFYQDASITLVPLGLAMGPGKRTLYVTKEPACSSLLEPDPVLTKSYPALSCAKHIRSIEVETTTLDAWARDAHVEAVDYLKIDTQGTELEILMGGAEILRSVRCLEVEVEFNPIYLGQPVFSDVDAFLRRQGFVLWKLANQVHYSSSGSPVGPMGEESVFYDDRYQVRHEIYGGQLYWANACYVRKDVLQPEAASDRQISLDVALFTTLGMPDVVQHVLDSQNRVTRQ